MPRKLTTAQIRARARNAFNELDSLSNMNKGTKAKPKVSKKTTASKPKVSKKTTVSKPKTSGRKNLYGELNAGVKSLEKRGLSSERKTMTKKNGKKTVTISQTKRKR